MIVKLTGGMGNQLFQYAMGRALASRYDVPLKLDRYFLAHQRPNQPFARRAYALDLFSIEAERASIAEVSQYVPLVAYQPRFRLRTLRTTAGATGWSGNEPSVHHGEKR